MIWLYRLVLPLAFLLGLPYYGWRMWRRGGYGEGWRERLGFWPILPPKPPEVNRIWLHAVSVGECLAAEPLLRAWAADPALEVIISTTTSTGYRLIRERYRHLAHIRAFPIDLWPCRVWGWRRARPDLLVLMEGELWPELLRQAARHRVPVVLANARLSDRSFRRYQALRWLAIPLLRPLSLVLAATRQDGQRFRDLRLPTAEIRTVGSLKFDVDLRPRLTAPERQALREELGFGDNPRALVLLGSSTWPGEEEALILAQQAAQAAGFDVRLLLVPRHAERRAEVTALLARQIHPWHQRSTTPRAPAGTLIYLADTTGELRRLTQVADLAFIGKSLPPHSEGQTPIEAAGFGVPLLFGPVMSNFRELARALVREEIAEVVESPEDLSRRLLALLQDELTRSQRSARGTAWFEANQGAASRTIEAVRELPSRLSPNPPVSPGEPRSAAP